MKELPKCPKCNSKELLLIESAEVNQTWNFKDKYQEPINTVGDYGNTKAECQQCEYFWTLRNHIGLPIDLRDYD
jgi:hypothetical protein